MTAEISVLDHLTATGEQTADQIAAALHIQIEHAYLELVRAEGAGLVRVNVDHVKSGVHRCSWESMREEVAAP